jgi:hypothetical protein
MVAAFIVAHRLAHLETIVVGARAAAEKSDRRDPMHAGRRRDSMNDA